MARLFAEAEHHRRRGAQPERVRLAHHLHPGVGGALERRDGVADLVVEDLGAAAGDRIEPCCDEALDHGADRHPFELGDVADLLRRQAMDGQREVGLHPAEELFVPGDRQVGVEAPLQQDLHAAQVDRLLELLAELVARQDVALGLVGGRAVEVAELAARDADVRVVDVAIDDVGDDALRVEHPAPGVGGGAQLQHRRLGVKAHRLLGRRRPPAAASAQERVDRSRPGGVGHGRARRRSLVEAGPRRSFDQPGGLGARKEGRHAGQLLGPQAIADVLREVRLVGGRIAAVRLGVRARDHRAGGEPVSEALLELCDRRRVDGAGPTGPHGVNEGEPGQRVPGLAQILNVREARLGLEPGVADHQRAGRALRGGQHLVVGHLAELRPEASLVAEQLEQHRRAARGAVERDHLHLLPRHLADQQHGAHGAVAGDGDAGDDAQLLGAGGVGADGDQPQVGVPLGQPLGAAGRQIERRGRNDRRPGPAPARARR